MTAPLSNTIEGERRKAEAFALLQAHREVYILRGRRALLAALLHNGSATIDAVRADVELPPDLGPVLFGVVPGPLVRLGIILPDGFAKSTRTYLMPDMSSAGGSPTVLPPWIGFGYIQIGRTLCRRMSSKARCFHWTLMAPARRLPPPSWSNRKDSI